MYELRVLHTEWDYFQILAKPRNKWFDVYTFDPSTADFFPELMDVLPRLDPRPITLRPEPPPLGQYSLLRFHANGFLFIVNGKAIQAFCNKVAKAVGYEEWPIGQQLWFWFTDQADIDRMIAKVPAPS